MSLYRYIVALLLLPILATPQIVLGQPFNENERLERAASVYQEGDCQYAEQLYQQVLEVNQNSALAYVGLGNSLYCQQRFDQAITAYTKAIQLNPENAAAYRGRGDALRKKEKLDQALADYQRAIQADPNHASAYLSIGHVLFYDKDQESEAIAAYQRAVELSPQWGYAWLSLAIALDWENREAKALDAYRKATEVSPNYTGAWNRLGLFLVKKGQLEEAIEAYSNGINSNSDCASARPSADPICADVYYNRAEARRRSFNLPQAIQDYQVAARLQSNKNNVFYITFSYLRQQQALEEKLERTLQQYPSAYIEQANMQLILGKIDESINSYQRAINNNPNDSEAYAGLSFALFLAGNTHEALVGYEKFINMSDLNSHAFLSSNSTSVYYSEASKISNQILEVLGAVGGLIYLDGKKEQLLSIIDRATEQDPQKSIVYLYIANSVNKFAEQSGIDPKQEFRFIAARAVNKHPNTVGAQLTWGFYLLSNQNFNEALEAFNKATKIDSQLEEYNWHHLIEQARLSSQGRINEALEVGVQNFSDYSGHFYLDGILGVDLYQAIEQLRNINYNDPQASEQFMHHWVEVIISILENATSGNNDLVEIENPSEIAENLTALANWMREEGYIDKANRIIELAENIAPQNPVTLIAESTFAVEKGDFFTAINLILQGQGLAEGEYSEYKVIFQDFNDLLNSRLAPQPENLVQPPLENTDDSTLRSVVKIPNNDGVGAGIVINRQGGTLYILTARHVIGGTNCINANSQGCQVSDRIAVEFYSPPGQQPIQKIAELLPQSWAGNLDLVVLTVSGGVPPDIQPLPIANTQPRRNDTLKVIGHPSETRQAWSIQPHRFINNISGQFACSQYSCLQLSEPQLSPGNSGGAVLNQNNEIVGIVIEGTNNENGNFAYSANTIKQALQQWGIHPLGQ